MPRLSETQTAFIRFSLIFTAIVACLATVHCISRDNLSNRIHKENVYDLVQKAYSSPDEIKCNDMVVVPFCIEFERSAYPDELFRARPFGILKAIGVSPDKVYASFKPLLFNYIQYDFEKQINVVMEKDYFFLLSHISHQHYGKMDKEELFKIIDDYVTEERK